LRRCDLLDGDVLDVRTALTESGDLGAVDIKTNDVETSADVGEDERQANIAETDDANDGRF
jgi:hypothetical protein